MTSTIIRLKRRLDDDAVDSFLVNTKRRKISVESDNDGLSTIFNFVGTGKSPEDVFEHIKKSTQSEVKIQSKFGTSNIIKKLKNEWQKNSKTDRFKVVNSFRFSNDTEQASSTDLNCTIVDVENNEKSITGISENIVYDFYTTNEPDATAELYEDALENVLSVCPLNKDMFCFRDEGDIDSDESDDSNAENHFANDYPDESEESDEEDDEDGDDEDNKHFRKQFRQVNFDDSYDDYYDEDNDLTRSDCDEYDRSCTP